MRIIAVLTDPKVVDRIIRHLDKNAVTVPFLLTPLSAPRQIDGLIYFVEGLLLHQGTENSLVKKLENAKNSFAAEDAAAACNLLRAFINEVEAQAGKKLTTEQADVLIAGAYQIRVLIGCG